MKKLNLPDWITLLRLVLIPILWALAILKMPKAFAAVFVITGLTDALDGFFARRFKQTSEFGAWFDSFADNIVSASSVFWAWLLLPKLLSDNLIVISVLLGLFALSFIAGFLKYQKMIRYHLYSDKAAAILLYLFCIHALLFGPNQLLFYITAIAIAICLTEEIAMTLTHKKMQKNKTTILD